MSVVIDALLPAASRDLSDTELEEHYSAGEGSPWLRVNFVSSIDGAATIDGKSGGLGTDADHVVFDVLRRLCDVVVVASGTVKVEGYGAMVVDDASAAARVARGLAPQPTFAIVSGSCDLDPESEVFTKAPVRPIVFTTRSATPSEALAKVADIVVSGTKTVDPVAMVAELVKRGLPRIHCEGGPTLFGSLIAAGVVDELAMTVSPVLVGGTAGRIAKGDEATPKHMRLAGILHSEGTLLLRYVR